MCPGTDGILKYENPSSKTILKPHRSSLVTLRIDVESFRHIRSADGAHGLLGAEYFRGALCARAQVLTRKKKRGLLPLEAHCADDAALLVPDFVPHTALALATHALDRLLERPFKRSQSVGVERLECRGDSAKPRNVSLCRAPPGHFVLEIDLESAQEIVRDGGVDGWGLRSAPAATPDDAHCADMHRCTAATHTFEILRIQGF